MDEGRNLYHGHEWDDGDGCGEDLGQGGCLVEGEVHPTRASWQFDKGRNLLRAGRLAATR